VLVDALARIDQESPKFDCSLCSAALLLIQKSKDFALIQLCCVECLDVGEFSFATLASHPTLINSQRCLSLTSSPQFAFGLMR
jgi:hypothetical protein